MPTLEQRVRFAESHFRTKEGGAFSLKDRDWVAEEFWGPCDGFKLWPKKPGSMCDPCGRRVNTMAADIKIPRCRSKKCVGLRLEPIIMTVLNLPRREGKTFNTAAFSVSTICTSNASMTFVAGSEDQTGELFEENYKTPISLDPKLRLACKVIGNKITVKQTKSVFEFVPTSHSSITGRGRSHVIIDEARDIPARVAMALIPSVFAENGQECPRGHVKFKTSEKAPRSCSVCGQKLRPWFGRIVIMSSSGIIEGNPERDWFAELVDKLEREPDPNVHLYRSDTSSNPDVSAETKGMVDRVFGTMESTRHYVDAEVHNVSRRKGEDFVSTASLLAVVDPSLQMLEGDPRPCFAFLDTSLSTDTTSLVIGGISAGDQEYPWQRIELFRVDTWKPQRLEGGVIDPAAIQAHFDRYIPMFPGLIELLVDVRAMTWARDFVIFNRKNRPSFGRKVSAFHGGRQERDISWQQLEFRILHKMIRIPQNAELIEEIKGVRRVTRADGSSEIRDRSRKKRHADIAESLAGICFRIYLEQTKPRAMSIEKANPAKALKTVHRPVMRWGGIDGF